MQNFFLFSLVVCLLICTACTPQENIQTEKPEADIARYTADVEFIAQAPRTKLEPHHQAVQDMCAERFSELGYTVTLHDFGKGVNVIGTLTGTTRPDEIVIVSAHYDTIPNSNGADDNASGVAGVLETARLLSGARYDRTLVVACWDQEEPALYGSYVYANQAMTNNVDIKVAYVYDEIGLTDDRPDSQRFPVGFDMYFPDAAKELKENDHKANFVLLIYDEDSSQWAQAISTQADKLGLPSIGLQANLDEHVPSELKGSDHASFWIEGYPAIEINDTSGFRNAFKHTQFDTVDRLDHEFATKIISAVTASLRMALTLEE
jgi:Zn-dependent M28 family amino/carboxypeptidase